MLWRVHSRIRLSETVTLVATDSRRLAIASIPARSEGVEELANPGPVIPAKAMRLIEKSITDDEQEVQVAINANDILVRCGQSTIYSRLVEGRFPEYNKLIDTSKSHVATIEIDSFHSAVRFNECAELFSLTQLSSYREKRAVSRVVDLGFDREGSRKVRDEKTLV